MNPAGEAARRQPFEEGPVSRRVGRTKGGLNSKLHALCDADGKPLILVLTEGQVSDYRGARAMLTALPNADTLIADSGYDSSWYREALADKRIAPCIPRRKDRKETIGKTSA